MAYDATTGQWKPDPGSTAENVGGMLSDSSPYVAQAKSAGMDVANQRGLQNSSIAAGASQKAAYDAVVPIAQNDANIQAQKDLQGNQIAATQKISDQSTNTQLQVADLNVASNKQDKSAAAAQNYASIYAQMVNTINNNPSIPAESRDAYLANAKTLYDNGLSLVEQTYNVQLDWGQGA